MAASVPSDTIHSLSGQGVGNRAMETPDQVSTQVRNQQMRVPTEPVAILWDIENCPVPGEIRAEDVAGNIRMALRVHPAVRGAVTLFSAYGDFNNFPRRLREGCQRTGVNLIDVPNGKKDAADKAILVDMFLFALDNPPPSTILLISGDVDFAPALHKLGQRGYTVVLAIPAGVGVSSALCNAGRFVWDWPSVARGEGLVPAKSFLSRTHDLVNNPPGCFSSDDSDFPNDEEAIVYRGIPQNGYIVGTSSNQTYNINLVGDTNAQSVVRNANSAVMAMHTYSQVNVPISRPQGTYLVQSSSAMQKNLTFTMSPPATYAGRPVPTTYLADSSQSGIASETTAGLNSTSWVQPGDIQGLKGQIAKLLDMYGGSLLLGRVPSEYHKVFGRPLYLAEYGSCKLVNLIKKMQDTFCIEGKGTRKVLSIRGSGNASGSSRHGREDINPSNKDLSEEVCREDHTIKKGKGVQGPYSDPDTCNNLRNEDEDYGVKVNTVCFSDEGSDDDPPEEFRNGDELLQADMNAEEYAAEARLEVFKQELQELLVSHACKILMSRFLNLYQQRYARDLDYSVFGVKELEALLEKVRDVAIMEEEQGTKRKFLVANCGS
eukprot:Gb_27480 [translate_table: standard]